MKIYLCIQYNYSHADHCIPDIVFIDKIINSVYMYLCTIYKMTFNTVFVKTIKNITSFDFYLKKKNKQYFKAITRFQ